MPEYIRALVVILVLATTVFYFAKTPATAMAIRPDDFARRRNVWFGITLAGFLSQNYWVFAIVAGLLLHSAARKDSSRIAMFFFLVLALPQIKVEIPGFAGIRYFFSVDYVRILTAVVLLPVCVEARRQAVANGAKSRWPDMVLTIYILLNLVVQAQYDIVTNVVRSALNWGVDVVVPYYAISRAIKDLRGFRDVLMSAVVAAMLASLVGVFEFVRHWILYASAGQALGVVWDPGYLARGEFLRAAGTSGQAIVLGYVIAIAIGFLFALRRSIPTAIQYLAGMALLFAGILSPLSRGPWVGLAIMVFIFTVLGERPVRQLLRYVGVVAVLGVILVMTGYGQRVVDYLPFVGSVDVENVTYRQNLFDTSFQIILDNPFFGSADYLLRMEELRQGQGIIDLVNSFLIVGLNTGFVGLGLYVLFITICMTSAYRRMKITPTGSESHAIGQALLAVSVGILIITATVSPISHVPLYLWTVAAMCLAYGALDTENPIVLEE